MANELPTFQELLAAQQAARGQGPAQAALTGINQGIDLGRSILEKNRAQEELKRQFQLKVQDALLEKRKVEAGMIPADKSLTGAETTPEVQKSLTPATRELGEAQGADEVITYDKSNGKVVSRIPLKKTAGKSAPQFLMKNKQQIESGKRFIDEVSETVKLMPQVAGKPSLMRGVEGTLKGLKVKAQTAAGGQFGGNPDLISYESSVPETLGRKIYKDISGDVGNISDSEGKTASKLLPRSTEAPEVRTAKIDRLKRLYEAADASKASIEQQFNAGLIDAETADKLVETMTKNLLLSAAGTKVEAAKPAQPAATPPEGMIRVREKASGKPGSLPANEFDATKYDRI